MLFVSNRDVVVRSIKTGMSILFKKGVKTRVPPSMHEDVMERGVLPVNDDGSPVQAAEHEAVVNEPKILLAPEDGNERGKKIKEVFKALIARNNATDFTASGTPNAGSVTAALGWKTDQKEVRQVWEKHREELVGARSQLAA